MKALSFLVYGFDGKGNRYFVLETCSANEARDVRDVRVSSGFRTIVLSSEGEMTVEELDQFADLETRFR